jgi:predicted nuclease of restriction endonuclease-like (RecB) superfamily
MQSLFSLLLIAGSAEKTDLPVSPDTSLTLLGDLKVRIGNAQMRAAVAVNSGLVVLYWQVGTALNEQVRAAGQGAKMLDQLARDLKLAFPELGGFSPHNLRYMRQFAAAWPAPEFWQPVVAKLSWSHHLILLEKLQSEDRWLRYAQAALESGWSRNLLAIQIDTRLLERQGTAQTNFTRTLPAPQSDLAVNVLKDPYVFNFLTQGQVAHERDLGRGLLRHLRRFLLELGVGIAYMGNRYRLVVGGEEFFLDMLFYHVQLHCYVVVELKVTDFKPEYAGKLSFYLTAVNQVLRRQGDAPTIGILLCKTKNDVIVEYTLAGNEQPIGVSTYTLADALPKELEGVLPTVAQLEAELERSEANQGQV